MQITITVPDVLPPQRIQQRIRELEESLREEARFIATLLGQMPAQPLRTDCDPWVNPDLDIPAADTGIPDLALNHDHYLYGVPKKP